MLFSSFCFLLVALLPAIAERLLLVYVVCFLPFRFVATASILARRSARFSVGFRLNACVFFRLSKPRLKSQPLGWPCGCRGYILLLLMSCFMHCATFEIFQKDDCPCVYFEWLFRPWPEIYCICALFSCVCAFLLIIDYLYYLCYFCVLCDSVALSPICGLCGFCRFCWHPYRIIVLF